MKMDLSKFKKISSDKNKTTLMHPSGHKIVVAHSALNKVNLDQLDRMPKAYQYQPGMANGGEVRAAPAGSDIFANNSRAIRKNMIAKPSPDFIGDDEAQMSWEDQEALERGESIQERPIAEGVQSEDIPRRYASGGGVSKEEIDASAARLGVNTNNINAYPVPTNQASDQNIGPVGPPSPLAEEVDSDYVPNPDADTSPLPPAPAYKIPPLNSSDPYAEANKTALLGVQKEQQGAQQAAVALGHLGNKEASADSMAANAMNSTQAHFQKDFQDLSNERQKIVQDFDNGHIDPERYIKKMSTGERILNGIALIVGGMGSALAKQPNLASNFLTDQINRDIDAQKANLQNKSTLLNSNLAQTGNLFKAVELTRMQTLDINAMHIKQLAAASQNPIQRANLLATSGKLDQEASNIQAQIAQRNALMQTYGHGGEESFQQRMKLLRVMGQDKFAEAAEKRHVPGVGESSKEVPQEVISEISTRQDFDNKVQDLMNFARQNSGSLNPATIKAGKAKAALVQDAYRRANKQGVFKESENEFVNGIVGNPTQFFQKYRSGMGYTELRRDNIAALNALKSSYGLPVTQQQQSGGQGAANIQMRKGVPYMKVPGGWKRVK